ncbi:LAME_0H15962g1_1 [Lachancea meyersii CBS 8951]|uniref:LAME_0H15962g1_1 n=1 Tax=Lachancea meyersii CBS 8951 TaxID=1266667 RepID=A0A1G4KI82_9SACH|nr:LAME_0H15962g1_1 [Lachancea meyersii CBS 8951]
MHKSQLSVNSVQSLVEPTTPPLGQMNNRQNHQRTHSLDLSGFNQFIQGNSPLMPLSLSPAAPAMPSHRSNLKSLPQINEFAAPARTVSGSTVSSASGSVPADLNWTPLEELDYVKLATDQFGCRFLQKKLETPHECCAVRDLMYGQISPFFLDLILDPFGNYLIQKLCECLTTDQKTQLVDKIFPHVFQISVNQYGTRSLQKIIDSLDTEAQVDQIISGFGQRYTSIDQVVVLINDLNGNHVVQKCIFKFPPTKFDFIIDAIVDHNNIVKVSTHKHGCCVLQKLLSVCTLQQIFKISVKIVQFLPHLINDQFGNYIIQFLLDVKELDFYLLGEIFDKLSIELCQLSCLKFSSNVVEKFIKKLFMILKVSMLPNAAKNNTIPDDVVMVAMRILLAIIDIFTANLNVLIRDNFGNYALQTLLDVKNYTKLLQFSDNTYVHKSVSTFNFSQEFTVKVSNLVILTKELLPSIKTTSYAKKIKLKVKAFIELTGLVFNDNTSPKNGPVAVNGQHHSNNRRQHARHYSLPANAYRHRRNSSSLSLSSGYPMFQPPHQHIAQPFSQGSDAFGNPSSMYSSGNQNHVNAQYFYPMQQRPPSIIYNTQPEALRPMENFNVPTTAMSANDLAYNDPRLMQIPKAQTDTHVYNPTIESSKNLYASSNNYENVNYSGFHY